MTDLTKLTLAEARAGLAAKRFSATELTRAFLEAIAAGNKHLNAYVLPTPEHALVQAKASNARQSLWGQPAPKSWFEEGSAFAGVAQRDALFAANVIVAS